MNKIETNGFLRALERQLQALQSQLAEIHNHGSFTPEAEDTLRAGRNAITKVTNLISETRGWNQ
jgi:prefoldin subunit 5